MYECMHGTHAFIPRTIVSNIVQDKFQASADINKPINISRSRPICNFIDEFYRSNICVGSNSVNSLSSPLEQELGASVFILLNGDRDFKL